MDGDFAAQLEGDPLLQIPDIYTKQIIDKLLPKYYEVLSHYIAQSNSFVENTGRYSSADIDSAPVLISIKDAYSISYLRSANDAIEEQINEVAEMIQEPLPLLDYSTLTGTYGGSKFSINIETELDSFVDRVYYRFHYRNESAASSEDDGKLFVNGADADIIESAKMCYPLLGSTKSEYFVDSGAGYVFVPDEYSILTQSIRSNSLSTAQPTVTAGVNTRLVDPETALSLSNNKASSGAVIESNPRYGISAFIQNTETSDYSNPLDGPLQEGDLIVKVNGRFLDYTLPFDAAVKAVYDELKTEMIANDDGNENGELVIEFYRNGQYASESFEFNLDESNGNYLTKGALFTLYDSNQGFGNEGYDASAGCNLAETQKNSDRCFGKVATMPVLDPAGSVAPLSIGGEVKFPQNIRKDDLGNNQPEDDRVVDIYQFPGGLASDYYQFEDIDEIYINSCYSGLPGVRTFENDSNPFSFVLDPGSTTTIDENIALDVYGRFLDAVGSYINNSDDDTEYPANFDQSSSVWQDIDQLTADDIVLNSGPVVVLSDFSDNYGIFDGKDNDNDGIRDFEYRDLDNDGILETKWWDFDEATVENAIPAWDLDQIARKMLSHDSEFTVPAGLTQFDEDITLKVNAHSYEDKEISSVIVHNEPTDHTIAEQMKSMGAFSLPIDNPRYVAFQTESENNEHYVPGEIVQIDYPNLFEADNLAQVKADLNKVATQLAILPGSYRVFGSAAEEGDYSVIQIQQKILNDYLNPVVENELDFPVDGFDLEAASTVKLYDALEWKMKNIDEKYGYILENYLNGEKNSFVADSTLFPSQAGYTAQAGYEAAYFVLDGEENYFELQFNQDLPENEEDEFFEISGPVGSASGEAGSGGGDGSGEDEAAGADGGGGSGGSNGNNLNAVPLIEFIIEVEEFLSYFTTVPNFAQACSYASELAGFANNGEEVPESMTISVDRNSVAAGGNESIMVTVSGVAELVTLEIVQSEQAPEFDFVGSREKVLHNGSVSFELRPTGNAGTATIQAVSSGGLSTAGIQITATDNTIFIDAPTSFVVDGESTYEVRADLLNSDFQMDFDAGGTLSFELIDAAGKAEIVGNSTVAVSEGSASVEIRSGELNGSFKIAVSSSDASYPVSFAEVTALAGEAFSIGINPESEILVANNQSKSQVEIIVFDEFGNVVDDSFTQVAVFTNENLRVNNAADLNSAIIGTQLSTIEGRAFVDIYAKDQAGKASMIVLLLTPELEELFLQLGDQWNQIDFSEYIGSSQSFTIADESEIDLQISMSKENVAVGGDSVSVSAQLLRNDEPVSTYGGPIDFKLANNIYGGFTNILSNTAVFTSSDQAGEVEVFVDLPGYISKTVQFDVLPAQAERIELTISEDSLVTGGQYEAILEARILDQYGNLVTNNNSTTVSFDSTDGTAEFVEFVTAKSAVALEGVATARVTGDKISGKANLFAEAPGLETGFISVEVNKRIDHEDAVEMAPRALYISLLGSDFGTLTTGENLASRMLFEGA